MITLPDQTTVSRGPLRGFWIAIWTLAGTGAVAMVAGRGWRRPGAVGAAAFLAGGVAGVVHPWLAWWPYQGWLRGSRRVARAAIRYTAWVTHTTAIAPLGPWDDPAGPEVQASAWVPSGTQGSATYRSPSADPAAPAHSGREIRAAGRWLRDTGSPRRRWLRACLGVLRWLHPVGDRHRSRTAAGDNYSLY